MKIMKIQKKSLEHVSETLKSFDTYPLFSAVSVVLDELKITGADRKKITDAILSESNELREICDEAKKWLDAVIEDLE